MDEFNLSKPLCIFILDLSDTPDILKDPDCIIQEFIDGGGDNINEQLGKPLTDVCPAIVGSNMPFKGWENAVKASKISSDYYALATNQPVSIQSQYKWIDTCGSRKDGSFDATTGYSYEPRPFVNREIKFQEPTTGKEIVIVLDRWGDYNSKISRSTLGKWTKQKRFHKALVRLGVGKAEKGTIEKTNVCCNSQKRTESDIHVPVPNGLNDIAKPHSKNKDKINDLDSVCSKDKVSANAFNGLSNGTDIKLDTKENSTNKNLDHVDELTIKTDMEITDENKNNLQNEGEEDNERMYNESPHSPLMSIQEETVLEDGQNIGDHVNKGSIGTDEKAKFESGVAIVQTNGNDVRSYVNTDVKTGSIENKTDINANAFASKKEDCQMSPTESDREKQRVPNVRTKSQSYKFESPHDEPVRLRRSKAKPISRPKSLDTNLLFGMSHSPRYATSPRTFTFTPDMKFNKFKRSTEEIFIETTPSRSYSRGLNGSHSSGSESDSFVSMSPSPRKDTNDTVFKEKKEAPEGEGPAKEKLSKVLLKDMFGDMMKRARRISSEFQRN